MDIAVNDEYMQQIMGINPTGNPVVAPPKMQVKNNPSAMKQFGDMAKEKVMNKTIDEGIGYAFDMKSGPLAQQAEQHKANLVAQTAATEGAKTAGLEALGGSAAAMSPEVQAALLAAKATGADKKLMGLFSAGGSHIKPQASIWDVATTKPVQYKAKGDEEKSVSEEDLKRMYKEYRDSQEGYMSMGGPLTPSYYAEGTDEVISDTNPNQMVEAGMGALFPKINPKEEADRLMAEARMLHDQGQIEEAQAKIAEARRILEQIPQAPAPVANVQREMLPPQGYLNLGDANEDMGPQINPWAGSDVQPVSDGGMYDQDPLNQ